MVGVHTNRTAKKNSVWRSVWRRSGTLEFGGSPVRSPRRTKEQWEENRHRGGGGKSQRKDGGDKTFGDVLNYTADWRTRWETAGDGLGIFRKLLNVKSCEVLEGIGHRKFISGVIKVLLEKKTVDQRAFIMSYVIHRCK